MKTKQLALTLLTQLDPTLKFSTWQNAVGEPIGNKLRDLAAALEADIAKPVEPVAYMTNDGRVSMRETVETAMPNAARVSFSIPLYTTPQDPAAPESKT